MSESKPRSTIEWMYEGQSSNLHQEEYLTGKKIDKNFDRFHGQESVKAEQEGVESVARRERTPPTTGIHGTMLDLRTVKNEDPLVAIKVKEEMVRKEILHNPMQMKRLQRLVAKEMEKKIKKMNKRSKKSRSKERSPRRNRHRSPSPTSYTHPHSHKHQERSPRNDRSSNRHSFSDDTNNRTSDTRGNHSSKRKEHVDYSDSDSDNERKKKKYSGYGLINASKSRSTGDKEEHTKHHLQEVPSKDKRSSKTVASITDKNTKPGMKQKLSEAEKEKRRREMLDNASWRDKQRDKKLHDASEREKREALAEAEDKRKKGSDFIRPMLSEAMDSGSVEQRIKSNIFSVDRRSKAMNSNFVKK